MKKYFSGIGFVILVFAAFKIASFLISYFSIPVIASFGASYPYFDRVLSVTNLPSWIWSWGGFDGVHYLRIAQNGYQDAYYQAFFPLFPLLIRFFNIFPKDLSLDTGVFVDPSYFLTGIILSNLFLFLSLVVLTKVVEKKDYLWSALLLLTFPTAFYFGAVYTESLFLFEVLIFIMFFKKKSYLPASIIALLASATRLIGVLLFLVLLVEVVREILGGKIKLWTSSFYQLVLSTLVAPLGLVGYMFYLKRYFGSYFAFVTVQSGFGAERSALPLVTLPQVFWRYLRMFATVKNSMQLTNISIEFVFATIGLAAIIWAFKKVDFGWWLFATLNYLLPTLTGTFSSMPRYLIFSYLVFLPLILKWPLAYRKILVALMAVIQAIFIALFTRGYWVA